MKVGGTAIVAVACAISFAAGAWLAPVFRPRPARELPASVRATSPQAEADPSRTEALSSISQRLDALDFHVRLVESRLVELRRDEDAGAPRVEPAAAHTADPSIFAKHVERMAAAPPARDILDQALRDGEIGPADLDAFHQRLNELPADQRPAMLTELHRALHEGKLVLSPRADTPSVR